MSVWRGGCFECLQNVLVWFGAKKESKNIAYFSDFNAAKSCFLYFDCD